MESKQQRDILMEILLKKNGEKVAYLLNKYKREIFKIIPELRAEDKFEHRNPWHIYDVWNHTLKAIEKSKPDLEIRTALLLHDIGKPFSYQDDKGIRHFKGHSEKSAEISKPILERLGFNAENIDNIIYLIKNHSTTIDVEKVNEQNIRITKKLLYVQFCDASAYNPIFTEKVFERLSRIGEQLILKEKSYKNEEQR